MYQLIKGCHYEGPHSCGNFFFEFDNAVERALLIIKEDKEHEDRTAIVLADDDFHHRSFWKEITDEKILEGWESKRVWFNLRDDPEDYDRSDQSRSTEYMIIKKIEIEDCAKVDNGIMIYTKEEIKWKH